MYIPKSYGMSKVSRCPFCEKQAFSKNKQNIPVCSKHKEENLPELKCDCGSYLDLLIGKYGPYFSCFKCGNKNFNRVLENNAGNINAKPKVQDSVATPKAPAKELVIDSNDPNWF